MSYYLGGYYLVRPRPLDFGSRRSGIVSTASDCINDNLVNSWSYSWTRGINKETKEAKKQFGLDDDKISEIRKWVDSSHDLKRLGWINVFADIESAQEYRRTFFAHLGDINLFGMYFDEREAIDLVEEFKPRSENVGEIGLYQTLSKQIIESKDGESLIGYDLVGIEDGGDFHSFHCHDIGDELSEKFGLSLNHFGLFDDSDNWKAVLDYLNDEENGCEPVPWFVAKIKLVADG